LFGGASLASVRHQNNSMESRAHSAGASGASARRTLEITRLRVSDGRHNYPFLCWHITVVKTDGSNSRALICYIALSLPCTLRFSAKIYLYHFTITTT
jgi:hypothetical protein